MTRAAAPVETARRKLVACGDAIQVFPERIQTCWTETLNDSARDIAIQWRVHRKPVSVRPIVQRHFHERLLKTRRIFATSMDELRRVLLNAVDERLAGDLQRAWPASDLDAFPFLDSSAILPDTTLPLPATMTLGVAEQTALHELRRRYEPIFATPLRTYGMRLADWGRRRLRAIEEPFIRVSAS